MPLDDFLEMGNYECETVLGDGDTCLYKILEEFTNAYDVDYNGHFGNYIFLSLMAEHDNEIEWKSIEMLIKGQIQKAKEFVPEE